MISRTASIGISSLSAEERIMLFSPACADLRCCSRPRLRQGLYADTWNLHTAFCIRPLEHAALFCHSRGRINHWRGLSSGISQMLSKCLSGCQFREVLRGYSLTPHNPVAGGLHCDKHAWENAEGGRQMND